MRVINLRRDGKIAFGDGGEARLARAIRVQANFIEYAPLTLLLLMLVEMQGAPIWAIHVLGTAFIASRAAHFWGFRSPEAPGLYRAGGMAGTFTVLLALAGIALFQRVYFYLFGP